MLFKSTMKILELTQTIEKKDEDIARLEQKLDEAEATISNLNSNLRSFKAVNDGTPEDCKRGSWCGACEFAKEVVIPGKSFLGNTHVTFCGKGESCSNFVQKEV